MSNRIENKIDFLKVVPIEEKEQRGLQMIFAVFLTALTKHGRLIWNTGEPTRVQLFRIPNGNNVPNLIFWIISKIYFQWT